ncbi:MAG: RIP metalloprotease RseP [Firmicutes bacterium]|nr:RIP metalloprotease RseP [Bacillota bacterium]
MTTVISAIIILGVLILFHELGHFSVAKLVDVKVHEFSIGMGPQLFKFVKGETLYSLRALPIGGYVKLEGEDQDSNDARAFSNKPVWARIAVLAAGAIMNFILGFLIFVILLAIEPAVPQPVVGELMEGMPAQEAGLLQGDRIVQLNEYKVNIQKDVSYFLSKNNDRPIDMIVLRDGQKVNVKLTPQFNEKYNRYMLGYTAKTVKMNFFGLMRTAYYETALMTKMIILSFGELFTGKDGLAQVSGPVGIVGAIGGAAKAGISPLLFLAALISINLGIFNLLPIPALDGSRIMFVVIEGIRRKPINPEKEGLVHMIGLGMLLLLMVIATFNDISRILGQ